MAIMLDSDGDSTVDNNATNNAGRIIADVDLDNNAIELTASTSVTAVTDFTGRIFLHETAVTNATGVPLGFDAPFGTGTYLGVNTANDREVRGGGDSTASQITGMGGMGISVWSRHFLRAVHRMQASGAPMQRLAFLCNDLVNEALVDAMLTNGNGVWSMSRPDNAGRFEIAGISNDGLASPVGGQMLHHPSIAEATVYILDLGTWEKLEVLPFQFVPRGENGEIVFAMWDDDASARTRPAPAHASWLMGKYDIVCWVPRANYKFSAISTGL
mgnify:CR=1 FL=1